MVLYLSLASSPDKKYIHWLVSGGGFTARLASQDGKLFKATRSDSAWEYLRFFDVRFEALPFCTMHVSRNLFCIRLACLGTHGPEGFLPSITQRDGLFPFSYSLVRYYYPVK